MNRRGHLLRSLGCHLAIVALFAQVMAPAVLAARPGVDVSGFLCAPLGTLSEEARAEAEILLAALPGDRQDGNQDTSHCPFCVLVHGVPLSEHHLTHPIVFEHQEVTTFGFESPVVYRSHGPPLGLRAPPPHSL